MNLKNTLSTEDRNRYAGGVVWKKKGARESYRGKIISNFAPAKVPGMREVLYSQGVISRWNIKLAMEIWLTFPYKAFRGGGGRIIRD